MKKSTVAAIAAVGATAAAAAAVPYFVRQNTDLTASHYVFRSPKVKGALEGFRITQISDLHNKVFGKDNCRLLALTEAQLPDLLVVTGDLTDSYHTDLDKALDAAERLAKLAPCYYVTGNHEHRMSREKQDSFYRALEDRGLLLLRNEAVTLGLGGGFRLLGVDCNAARTDVLRGLMADRPSEELNILLAHKPHYAGYYEEAGVDLVLTGHAHGGQWRFPGLGAIYAPGQGLLPKYTAGMYRLGNTVMCVSRGLGNSSFPLRIENKPELVTVTLRSAHN
jgi:hypothetical protein